MRRPLWIIISPVGVALAEPDGFDERPFILVVCCSNGVLDYFSPFLLLGDVDLFFDNFALFDPFPLLRWRMAALTGGVSQTLVLRPGLTLPTCMRPASVAVRCQ